MRRTLTDAPCRGPGGKPLAPRRPWPGPLATLLGLAATLLAEAERPGVDPAASGGGFWVPGPERLHGWALRDLRDYLQRMTGGRFPLTTPDARAGRGIYAGIFGQFPSFKPRQGGARRAF